MVDTQAQLLPYKLLHRYPGMRPRDEVIWDKFVHERPGAFDVCYYNVPIGEPARDEDEREEMRYNGGDGVSYWRVDVLARKGEQEYVIEVKPDARAGSLGQVLAYKAILVAEGKVKPDAIPLVITDDVSMIMLQSASLLGVAVQAV